MKIAQVCPRYYPDIGGVETHVQEISERLVKRGFEVDVLCTGQDGPKHEILNGVVITRFRSFAPGEAYYFAPQIYFYLKNHEYDLIHAHSYHALPALLALLAKENRNFIFTPHYHRGGHTFLRNIMHKPYKIIGNKIFENADKVISVSEYEKRNIILDFNVPTGKIEKIPNGLHLEEFDKINGKKHNREKTLLYIGRLEKYKGIQHIIKTLPYLKDFKMEIIGKGPYENNLRKQGKELAISQRIRWYKDITRKELIKHYASADVFLMLSTHEAYGITVAEALASGTPCIVTNSGALSEFVDGKMCFGITLPIETDALLKTIREAVTKQTKYDGILIDWDEVVKRLIKIYEDK